MANQDPNDNRHPSSLQDVLNLCVANVQPGENQQEQDDSIQQTSQTDKEFLHNALAEFLEANDDPKRIRDGLAILNTKEVSDDDKLDVLELLLELCSNIDCANVYSKLDVSFAIALLLLSSSSRNIRAGAAELLGTVFQNNPTCQILAINTPVLTKLLDMVENDEVDICRVKALYGISCLTRGSEPNLSNFLKRDGLSYLMRALQSQVEKLQLKSAFLLRSTIADMRVDGVESMVNMGMTSQLIGVIGTDESPLSEHLLMCIKLLIEVDPSGRVLHECRQPDLGFQTALECRINADGCDEETLDTCRCLHRLCFEQTISDGETER